MSESIEVAILQHALRNTSSALDEARSEAKSHLRALNVLAGELRAVREQLSCTTPPVMVKPRGGDAESMLRESQAQVATLREALEKIAAGSPPDDWEPHDNYGDYNGFGQYGDPVFVDGVDPSNNGDVHSHGWDCGRWSAAKEARAALALVKGETT